MKKKQGATHWVTCSSPQGKHWADCDVGPEHTNATTRACCHTAQLCTDSLPEARLLGLGAVLGVGQGGVELTQARHPHRLMAGGAPDRMVC